MRPVRRGAHEITQVETRLLHGPNRRPDRESMELHARDIVHRYDVLHECLQCTGPYVRFATNKTSPDLVFIVRQG